MAATAVVRKTSRQSGGKERAAKEIEFSTPAPGAKAVYIAGTFNQWNPTSLPLKKDKDGKWKIRIKLASGKHEYKYVVDGSWAQDTKCPESVLNSFGSYNSVIGI